MDRRHLRGSEKTINGILKKFGLEKIKIRYPRELKKKAQRESLSSSLNLFKVSLKTAPLISSANLTGCFSAGIKTFFLMVKQFVSEYSKIFGNGGFASRLVSERLPAGEPGRKCLSRVAICLIIAAVFTVFVKLGVMVRG